jgi:hypothetical protein
MFLTCLIFWALATEVPPNFSTCMMNKLILKRRFLLCSLKAQMAI